MEAVTERGDIREKVPTRWESLVFQGKVLGLRAKRWWDDRAERVQYWPVERNTADVWPERVGTRSWLWVDTDEQEKILEVGKVHNLRLACACLDGVVIEANGVFSFWAQIGRASRERGFVEGRMIQQGCVIPSVGGGLCQLSNALYGLAIETGADIVERHAHSVRVAGVPVRDATVAWNYVDLRFRVKQRTKIVAKLSAEELIIALETKLPVAQKTVVTDEARPETKIQNCLTCNEVGCFRHQGRGDGR